MLTREKAIIEMQEVELRAWDALSRYKFYLFGYWACHWVNLNRYASLKYPNPFHGLVKIAKRHDKPVVKEQCLMHLLSTDEDSER